jgi:hypothetical protein
MDGSIEAERSDSNLNISEINRSNNNSMSSDLSLEIINNFLVIKDEKQFICKVCKSSFLLIFNKDSFSLYCKCDKDYSNQNQNREEINNNISCENKDNSIVFTETKYTSYCKKCEIDLEDKSKNAHVDHSEYIIDFKRLNVDDDVKIIIDLLLDDNKNNNIKFKEMNKNGKLKEKIQTIINDYSKKRMYYNLFKSIKNIIDYFKLKIYSIVELEVYIESVKSNKKNKNIYDNDFENIRIINLEGVDNNNILEKLCCNELKDKLGNIIQLNLMNSNIYNIKPLLNVYWPNLEGLSLKSNKLRDDAINDLQKVNMPKLKELSLENNNLKDYIIFKVLENFKNLKKVDLGSNGFTNEKINIKYLNNISLNSITELYASTGVFDDITIDLLLKFDLENLKILKLNGSYLNYLSFKKILSNIYRWKFLEELHLNNNNIIGSYNDEIKCIVKEIKENMQSGKALTIGLNNNKLKEKVIEKEEEREKEKTIIIINKNEKDDNQNNSLLI